MNNKRKRKWSMIMPKLGLLLYCQQLASISIKCQYIVPVVLDEHQFLFSEYSIPQETSSVLLHAVINFFFIWYFIHVRKFLEIEIIRPKNRLCSFKDFIAFCPQQCLKRSLRDNFSTMWLSRIIHRSMVLFLDE